MGSRTYIHDDYQDVSIIVTVKGDDVSITVRMPEDTDEGLGLDAWDDIVTWVRAVVAVG